MYLHFISPMKTMRKSSQSYGRLSKWSPRTEQFGFLAILTCLTFECPKRSCKLKTMYDDFLENLTNLNLEQIVKIPTRNDNVLDLFLSNQPGKVHEHH